MDRNQFLENLYKFCEGQIELRALPGKHREFFDLDDYKGIDAFCQKHSKENAYFAVATRQGGGTKEHVNHIPAAWVDIDFKDTPKETATKRLKEFPLQPSFVIASGGGRHPYWMFKEPLGKEDIQGTEYLLRQLATHFDGDMAATDASRILRLPDTENFKYKPPRPVKIISHNDARYDPSDFEFLPALECDPQGSTLLRTSVLYKGSTKVQHSDEVQHDFNTVQHVQHAIDFQQGGRDETLFSIADHLRKGGLPRVSIEKVIRFCAKHCEPEFPEREALAKVDSAFKRGDRQDESLTQRIREFISSTWGAISSTQVCEVQQVQHLKDRRKVSTILGRLVKEGILEKDPKRYGWYQVVDRNAETIDFMAAQTTSMPIKWPFEIENLVEIMPGNLIVVAGEIESGKTAFLLNLARYNMSRAETYYFSSEMGASELRKRLEKFKHITLEDWKVLKFKARAGDFQDVIRPDAVNIIDFIEVHDEFYKVGSYLKQIHDKLGNGIAVVAIQKNPGRDEGLGGQRSMEVARLYVALSKEYPGGRIKIVKGKNWATDRNPNGLSMKYKIVNGCQLISQGDWHRNT